MTLAAVEAPAAISGAIGVALARAKRLGRAVLLCVSRPLDAQDMLPLIVSARAAGVAAALFERRAADTALAALGTAWSRDAEGPERIAELAATSRAIFDDAVCDGDAAPLAVAAFGFGPATPDDDVWHGFPAARVVIPRAALVRRRDGVALLLHVLVSPADDAARVTGRLTRRVARLRAWGATPDDALGATPATRYTTASTPEPSTWMGAVAATTADIAAGRFAKLVLARACQLTATRPFDCGRAVARLRQGYPSCTTFWLGGGAGDFLGATPELLARVRDGELETAALAGTAARGTTTASDDELAAALLASDKDRREHAVVVDAIRTALVPWCENLSSAATPQILRLPNVQHLLTPMRARLAPGAHLLDVVAQLHPTPAVGGAPRDAALAVLPQREDLVRGWYAGPVGWFDAAGDGEFVVAIRSALVRERRAVLFAGAGIVAGSDPDAELAETRLKLQPLLGALLEL
ncbi:MAG: isochorismate synthase [bacterium]